MKPQVRQIIVKYLTLTIDKKLSMCYPYRSTKNQHCCANPHIGGIYNENFPANANRKHEVKKQNIYGTHGYIYRSRWFIF